jgi:hypothetical protein
MKNLASFLILLLSALSYAQDSMGSFEKYPVFSECSETTIENLEDCFTNTIQQFVFTNFKSPEIVFTEEYNGSIAVFFEVDKEGGFKVLYIDAVYTELKEEVRRVFSLLPKITPATYNGNPTYVQFTMPIVIPLKARVLIDTSNEAVEVSKTSEAQKIEELAKEYDAIEKIPYANDEYKSNLNIPLSNHNYSKFDPSLNRVGLNNHTAQKPYI